MMSERQTGTPVTPTPTIPAAPPPPPPVIDAGLVHRRFEHLLIALEQAGVVTEDVLHGIRTTP
jgi:hypothetical protein